MHITIRNSSGDPIYQQIVTQIKSLIMSGELSDGAPLPSMRNLAKELRISVITTKRAYEELERDGFIESFTGKGCFVSNRNTELIKEEHYRNIEDLMQKAVAAARLSGIGINELYDILNLIYEENE
jgi:GntR family transcriptional regulator